MSEPESALRIPHSAFPPTPNTEHPTPNTIPFRAIAGLVVSIGLFSQVAQIVMFREMLAARRGTELFFGVVLAAGLLWTALGSAAASLVSRRMAKRVARSSAQPRSADAPPPVIPSLSRDLSREETTATGQTSDAGRQAPERFLGKLGMTKGGAWAERAWASAAALFSLNGFLLIGQIAMARHRSAAWGGAAELTFLEAVGTAILATGPVAFLSGVEFVLALQAARPEAFTRLYQADAWGAVLGGLLFTFALVALVDPATLGPALGGGLCLLVAAMGAWRWMATGAVLGLAAAVAAGVSGLDGRLHAQHWRALYPGFKLCATQDSRYGQLAVLRHPTEEQYSFYVDGGLAETLPPADAPLTDERNQALLALAQHPAPKRVLLVGKALGRLPKALLDCGVGELDALELDPSLFALASRFLRVPAEDPRLRVHFADARRFIKEYRGAGYDLILLNLPDPLSAFVNRFYTVEFFREAREALASEGVLVTSVTAAANYAGETVGQLSTSILRTLRAVFPDVLVAPGESHTFLAGRGEGLISLAPAVLGSRIAKRGLVPGDINPDDKMAYAVALFENLIVTSQVASLRESLEAIPAPVNTDARPIAYQLALRVWNQIVSSSTVAQDPGMRGGTNALFRAALEFRFAHGLVLPALILVPCVVLLGRAGRGRSAARGLFSYGALVVAAATGLFGMAAEIIIIFAFQSTYGYAYAEVGLLVAAFMVGLALGARLGGRHERSGGFLAAVVGAMVAYCLLLPPVFGALAVAGGSPLLYPLFLLLVILAGLMDGATFPPLVEGLRRQGIERPGGWVYAADLAGSGIGALLTGALLVPVLGDSAALLLVAATLAAAMACFGAAWLRVGRPR